MQYTLHFDDGAVVCLDFTEAPTPEEEIALRAALQQLRDQSLRPAPEPPAPFTRAVCRRRHCGKLGG